MKITTLIVVALLGSLLCFATTHAQTPNPLSFFPHHRGDVWQYFVYDGIANDTLQARIIVDSLDQNGQTHILFHLQSIGPIGPPLYPWFDRYRINQQGLVYASGMSYFNRLQYRFDLPVRGKWVATQPGPNYFEMGRTIEITSGTLFGTPTTFRRIEYYSTSDSTDTIHILRQYRAVVADGFGVVFFGGPKFGYELYLMGGVINGQRFGDTIVVSVSRNFQNSQFPSFELFGNFPNPFNPITKIRFRVSERAVGSIVVYDMLAREIVRLADREQFEPGEHQITWTGKNNKGGDAASGTYLCKLDFGNRSVFLKMALIR